MTIHGSGTGYAQNLFDNYGPGLTNTQHLRAVTVGGKPLPDDMLDMVISADLEMGVDQVTELTFTFDDPGFKILSSGKFDLDTPVLYRGLHLSTAVLETTEGGGLGGLTVRCRPLAVRKLKKLRGDRVLHQITPAAYLRSECKKAGIAKDPLAQKSAKKKKIARDVKEDGARYDPASYPSAWTTMQRLAGELGYLLYEVGGTIFFGQPTWLVRHQPTVEVMWYPENGMEPLSIPEFRHSEDSKDLEISLTLPLERAGSVFPGVGIKISGFPKYTGKYFINSVAYPLAGDGTVTVTASTIRNPEPQTGTGTSTSSVTGDWVNDADKRGDNCKYTPREMVDRAFTYIKPSYNGPMYSGHCQQFVDVLAKGGDGGGAYTAREEWAYMPAGTQHGTDHDAPAGAVLCWSHPHTAISVGNGQMITTTGNRIQKMGITKYLGMSSFLGWKYPNLV